MKKIKELMEECEKVLVPIVIPQVPLGRIMHMDAEELTRVKAVYGLYEHFKDYAIYQEKILEETNKMNEELLSMVKLQTEKIEALRKELNKEELD